MNEKQLQPNTNQTAELSRDKASRETKSWGEYRTHFLLRRFSLWQANRACTSADESVTRDKASSTTLILPPDLLEWTAHLNAKSIYQ